MFLARFAPVPGEFGVPAPGMHTGSGEGAERRAGLWDFDGFTARTCYVREFKNPSAGDEAQDIESSTAAGREGVGEEDMKERQATTGQYLCGRGPQFNTR